MTHPFHFCRHWFSSLFLLTFSLLLFPAHAAKPTTAKTETPIYLYQSPLTAAFFKANGAQYNTLLVRWRNYLNQYGARVKQPNRAALLAGLPPGILVLGSAVLLDQQERAAIEAYAKAGGSLILSWGTGARDGKGAWVGYDFLEQLMDVKVLGTLDREQDNWFLNPFGDGPITHTVPAGKRIYLGRTAETPLRLDSRNLAARYLNWGRNPADNSGAIAYTEKAGSRRIMLGFSEASWQYDQDDDLVPILDASFVWLGHKVKIYPATWPQGFLAAQLLEMDTEDKFSNAEAFANDLAAIGVKGTFFCVTSIGKSHKKLLNQLAEKHEVAYHGDVHIGFEGKSPVEQEQRIKTMKKDFTEAMAPAYAAQTFGFRAPTESSDEVTEKLLRKYGFRYYVSQPQSSDARVPFFSTSEENLTPEEALVILPRTQNDDLNFAKIKKTPELIMETLTKETDYIVEMGALGILSVHSQNYADAGVMSKISFMRKLMPVYLQSLKQRKEEIWITTGIEISQWWRARTRVTLDSSSEQFTFQVTEPGISQSMSFFITHPKADNALLQIQAMNPGLPAPQIKRIDAFRSAIIFKPLAAGKYAYQIQFQAQNPQVLNQ
jgi:hypothetical protein